MQWYKLVIMFLMKHTGMLMVLQIPGLFMQHTGRRPALARVVGRVLDVVECAMSCFSGMLHLQPSFFNALCSAIGLRIFFGVHFQPVSPLQRCAWAHSMLGAGHLPLGPKNADV